jgi:hypothetical protein
MHRQGSFRTIRSISSWLVDAISIIYHRCGADLSFSVGRGHGYFSCPSPLEDSLGTSDAPGREDRSLRGHEFGNPVSPPMASLVAVLTQD